MNGRLGLIGVVCAAVLLGVTTLAAPPTAGQTGIVAQQSSIDTDNVRITGTAGDAIDDVSLDGQTSLRVQCPDGYTVQSVTPVADRSPDNAVVWGGAETDVVTGDPRIVLTTEGGGLTPAMLIGVILVILLAGVGGWFYQRQPSGGDSLRATTDGDAAHADREMTTTDSASEATTTTAEGDKPDPERLSNEE
jgi:hypothetical protein